MILLKMALMDFGILHYRSHNKPIFRSLLLFFYYLATQWSSLAQLNTKKEKPSPENIVFKPSVYRCLQKHVMFRCVSWHQSY